MLSFSVYLQGRSAESLDLTSAYLIGTDDVPLRAEIAFENGLLVCRKRASGPAGLALMWEVPSRGKFLLDTARLMERPQPYVLQLELVRGRLIRLFQKIEEWELLDFENAQPLKQLYAKAQASLLTGMQADSLEEAAKIGDEALTLCLEACDQASLHHAQIQLEERLQAKAFGTELLGCEIDPARLSQPEYLNLVNGAFDFVTLPMTWKRLEAQEKKVDPSALDACVKILASRPLAIKSAPLLAFHEGNLPDWFRKYEGDYEAIRDLIHDHVKRLVSRYHAKISWWNVASGLHGNQACAFTFEQVMAMTRLTAALVKRVSPNNKVLIDIDAPWGEYYASNPRSIPPSLYMEMVLQSGVQFDGFGVRLRFGAGAGGQRDWFHLSMILDRFGFFGKPLHVTAVEVPSRGDDSRGGYWRQPWDETTQRDWVTQFIKIALSRPFVESISWGSLADGGPCAVPHGGLVREDLSKKPSYLAMAKIRAQLNGPAAK